MAVPKLNLPSPKPLPYSIPQWQAAPWTTRMRMACEAWAADGYGAPLYIYLLYVLKALLYMLGWFICCHFNTGFEADPPQVQTALAQHAGGEPGAEWWWGEEE